MQFYLEVMFLHELQRILGVLIRAEGRKKSERKVWRRWILQKVLLSSFPAWGAGLWISCKFWIPATARQAFLCLPCHIICVNKAKNQLNLQEIYSPAHLWMSDSRMLADDSYFFGLIMSIETIPNFSKIVKWYRYKKDGLRLMLNTTTQQNIC